MKIMVTGSNGFIGKHLVMRLLLLNHEVYEIDKTEGNDLTKVDCLSGIDDKIDIVYHLAAKVFVPDSYNYPRDFYYDNIVSTLNVLEFARKSNAKFIYQSSYMYGPPKYLPIDEIHPVFAYNPYANSKLICEELCNGYHRDFGLQTFILRPFNVYGPGQTGNFLIPEIVKGAHEGKISLKDPHPKRDFLYIDDMVNALLSLIDYKGNHRLFNVGYGDSYSVSELSNMVRGFSKKPVEVTFSNQKRVSEVNDLVCDNGLIRQETGWEPLMSIKQGLRLTYERFPKY